MSDSAGHAYEMYFKKTHPDPTGSGFVRPSPAGQDFESGEKFTQMLTYVTGGKPR